MKKSLFWYIKLIFTLVVLTFLIIVAWRQDQLELLWNADKDWGNLLIAFALSLGAILLTFARWYLLGEAIKLPLTLMTSMRFGFIGFAMNFVAFGTFGGDALRAFLTAKQAPGRRAESVATVALDRAIGLLGLFVVTGSMFWMGALDDFLKHETPETKFLKVICNLSGILAIVGFVGLCAVLLSGKLLTHERLLLLDKIPIAGRQLRKVLEALTRYSARPGVIFFSLFLSFIVHFANSLAIFFIGRGLCLEVPNVTALLASVPLAHVAGVLPVPGGIGTFEVALAFLYKTISLDPTAPSPGLAVALGYRIFTIIIAVIGTIFYLSGRAEVDAARETLENYSYEENS